MHQIMFLLEREREDYSLTIVKTQLSSDNQMITDNKIEKDTKKDKEITVSFEDAYEDYDIYLSIKNLHKQDYSKSKESEIQTGKAPSYLKKINWAFVDSPHQSESFKVNVEYGSIKKEFLKQNTNWSFENMGEYVCYLGEYNGQKNEITLTLSQLGTYSWDSIEVIQVPKGALDNSMQKLQDNSLNVDYVGNDKVTGSVNIENDGILFLSVIKTPGWQIFIDGKEAETFTTDIAFTGCKVSAGNHKVEMVYSPPFSKTVLPLSVLGIVGLVVIIVFRKHRNTLAKGKKNGS